MRECRRGRRGQEVAVRGRGSGPSLGTAASMAGERRWAARATEEVQVGGEEATTRGSWNQGKSGLREGQWSTRGAHGHPHVSGAVISSTSLGLSTTPVDGKGERTRPQRNKELLRGAPCGAQRHASSRGRWGPTSPPTPVVPPSSCHLSLPAARTLSPAGLPHATPCGWKAPERICTAA